MSVGNQRWGDGVVQRGLLWLTVSLAVAFSASAPAGAQSGSGSANPPASTKSVKRFIKSQARIVAKHQQPVFPNARIVGRKTWARCVRIRPRQWYCVWSAYIHERSTIDPPAEYDPEWPIRQGTLRTCGAPGEGTDSVLTVRQNGPKRYPRRLRVVGGWRLDCALTEDEIEQWNKYGPDYQPNVSEPTPHEVIEPELKPQQRDDLLPPPSGEPGGPPPGPISRHGGAESTSTARSATHIFRGCTAYERLWSDPRYWIYFCGWGVDYPPFGAGFGIFNQTSMYYEVYYWAGNDSAGRPINRLFASGTWNP